MLKKYFLGGFVLLCLWASESLAQTPTPIIPTPNSFAFSAGARIREFPSGAAIKQGDLLYIDPADGKAKLANASGGAAAANVSCIAAGVANDGGRVRCATFDPALTVGQAVVRGELYVVSGVDGRMSTAASLISGNYVTFVGFGLNATQIIFDPMSYGVAVP